VTTGKMVTIGRLRLQDLTAGNGRDISGKVTEIRRECRQMLWVKRCRGGANFFGALAYSVHHLRGEIVNGL